MINLCSTEVVVKEEVVEEDEEEEGPQNLQPQQMKGKEKRFLLYVPKLS